MHYYKRILPKHIVRLHKGAELAVLQTFEEPLWANRLEVIVAVDP